MNAANLGRVLTNAERCIRLIDASGVTLPPAMRSRYERARDTIRSAAADELGVPLLAFSIPLVLGAGWALGQIAAAIGMAGGPVGHGILEAGRRVGRSVAQAGGLPHLLLLGTVGAGAYWLARRWRKRRR